ncbi:SH3 domain-containing protein Dlish [Nilaparvata lugens]|uniref:SH3 domain-containing protein Dlish n=1 Tax=Nilaparvata lugens TaxID=108931 RepID=UPI00193DFF8C|nr:SH3 domain-containing protein Dlish [Nilaparvata lugens]XP_022191611.2 SH3 domain-containing protein Dlish [Nilaparvata lugens]
MGLRHSSLSRPRINLTWVVRSDLPSHSSTSSSSSSSSSSNANTTTQPRSDVNANKQSYPERQSSVAQKRSPCSQTTGGLSGGQVTAGGPRRSKQKHRHVRRSRTHTPRPHAQPRARFGYDITDVDAFLTKASLDSPGNIPVVLSSPCLLYQTRIGGFQDEIALPLGMVVNAVFKNQTWLYVQTPHGEEGYVQYGACLPLGILPPKTPAPCWETHTDIFPQPLGNRTDNEKLRNGTRSECGGVRTKRHRADLRDTVSACGERSVDKLYLRATGSTRLINHSIRRQTLLVITSDYIGQGRSTLTVKEGDVVVLINDDMKDWFWVQTRSGQKGFIPAVIAGNGFL